MKWLGQSDAQRRADEIKARRLAERAARPAAEPVFDTRPGPLVAVPPLPCAHRVNDWTCVSPPHPDSPNLHYYVKKAS